MALAEKTLVNSLRNHCKQAKKRIWFASPFIGRLNEVYKIIDGVWKKPSVDFKVLTDAVDGFIRKDTLDEFMSAQKAEVRSLNSLHAKVYIIDDWCLVTSANLTGAAFSKRYEIGLEADVNDIEKQFNIWWNKATPIKLIKKVNNGSPGDLSDYQCGRGTHFSKICDLPPYNTTHTDKFLADCDAFKEFAYLYEKVTHRNTQMKRIGVPLYLEVDYFFNYLYNNAEGRPSKAFKNAPAKTLTPAQREKEILKYFRLMPFDQAEINDRLKRVKTAQTLLSPARISSLNKKDIREVLDCFHCLFSRPINKTKILNNNPIPKIRKEWNRLLNTGSITSQAVADAISQIKNFGDSSASELIAWYKPEDFPIMNLNSKSGMRFFGIDIK